MVYKNFVVHPDTVTDAHLAGCAAHSQGKFKAFKDVFWEKGFGAYAATRDPAALSRANILGLAKDVGIDATKLETEMDSAECKAQLEADMRELSNFGVNGTPSFFVNGKFAMFSGPEALIELIDAEIDAVAASKVAADRYYDEIVMATGEKRFRSRKDAQGGE